ncbi:MAG: winged helix DNA-binding domain-containing protein [Candidatus Lokiarchaeota archaeon]|nr:winged helix DNA-binding domain-containing protein [Candidatus Lokiarchaeota archaeon]
METFELDQVNPFILKKQHLLEDNKTDDIVKITEDLCGLHSTELTTSYLSLFARTNNFLKSNLEKELYLNKTLARIRGMRKTLFIESVNLIPIVYAATSNIIESSFEKYMEFHKIPMNEYHEISQNITNILKGRELSASEIRKELNSKSNIPAIIQVMCNYGLLIRGKPIKDWKDRRNKYTLFKNYFPELELTKLNEKDAIQLLIEKYIKSYGPVSENDISWWTGLTKTKIRDALKSTNHRFEKVKISELNNTLLMFKEDIDQLNDYPISGKRTLNLLPRLDPYPMGYKDRDRYIDEKNYSKVFDRSGNIASTIFLDGVAIGVWDIEDKPEPIVKIYLFQSIEKDLIDDLFLEAQEMGKFFFDESVQIKECKSMIPLTERNAGGFMTPLKNC